MLLNVVLVDDDVLDDRGSVDGGTSRLCSARDDVGYATERCWLCSNMICIREGTLSSFSPPAKGRLRREVVFSGLCETHRRTHHKAASCPRSSPLK